MSQGKNKSRESGKASTSKKGSANPALEEFIYNASDLLSAFPSSSVSIANHYGTSGEKHGVKFTISHSGQSKYLTYETFDTKEVSRLLAFIGPGGVTAESVNSDRKKSEKDENDEAGRKQERITGLTSIMANHNFHSS